LSKPEPAVWPGEGEITLRLADNANRVRCSHAEVRGLAPLGFRSVRRIPNHHNKQSVPRQTYLMTLRSHLDVESGLEEALALDLDGDPDVIHVVGQPALFPVRGLGGARGHFVDLMDVRRNGAVTVWFVRAPDHMDARAIEVFDRVKALAADVGWRTRLFTGHSHQRSVNLAAIRPFRDRPFWADAYEPTLMSTAQGGGTVHDYLSSFPGDRAALSVLWWAVNRRRVQVDLEAAVTRFSVLGVGPGGAS
jgi:hypothetical protein